MNRFFSIIAMLAMLFAYATGAIASEKVVEEVENFAIKKEG